MKEKLAEVLKNWTKIGLLWLVLAFVLRISFFFVLLTTDKIELASFATIVSGIYFDIALVFFVGAIALVPYMIIDWYLPKTTYFISVVFITLYTIIHGCLIGYYSNVMQPLDRVFFVYSPEELYNIVVSSVKFSFWPLLGVLAIVFLYVLLLRFWRRKININQWVAVSYLVASLLFVMIFNFKSLITNDKPYKTYQDYCLAVNQVAFTFNDFAEYYNRVDEDYSLYDESVLNDVESYHKLFPNYNYVDDHYPFLRENNDPDVLGCRLNKTNDNEAPDFVFIIVESLGQKMTSSHPKMSFTPFLDSLKSEGLYWPNALALAERTFGAVPNIFSSAPYDKTGFARPWFAIPDHNSILKDMTKNGYTVSFFYGGNASFDGQEDYMHANGVSYMMNPSEADFDQEQKELLKNNNSWGMYDRDMFAAAMKHLDTVDRKRPSTDIYITLSTHEPCIFKGQDEYIKRVEDMVAQNTTAGKKEKETILKNLDTYSSYLYSDDCIRYIFNYYKRQPSFENTIFVIAGDHRMGRIFVNADPILKYCIPMVIYSPLVKEPKTFKGVVTHHDVAPTLTAYLHKNYDYHIDNECHWIGTSFDTSAVFRSNQSVSFMLNNREEVEYLHHDYFICRDRVYKVNDSLFLDEIDNDSINNQLQEYLRQYKNIDWYVTRNDYLLKKPDNLINLLDETNDETKFVSLKAQDSYELCKHVDFGQNMEKIYVDVSFDYKLNDNVDPNFTYVVFKINDQRGNTVFYKAFRFSEMSSKADNGYNLFRTKTTLFMLGKEISDLPMKILLYSRDGLDIEYKSLKVKVDGLQESR